MRFTKHTDYALRVLIYLATRSGDRVSTQHIANCHQISHAHLQKVVRALCELGYVELHRGPGGGVELAKEVEDLSIGALLRQLDDASALVECFRPESNGCVIAPACFLKGALAGAQEAFYAKLDPLTIGDVVRGRRASRLRMLTGD